MLVILCTFSNASNAAPPTCSSEDCYDYWGYDLGQTKNVSNAAGTEQYRTNYIRNISLSFCLVFKPNPLMIVALLVLQSAVRFATAFQAVSSGLFNCRVHRACHSAQQRVPTQVSSNNASMLIKGAWCDVCLMFVVQST